MADGTPNSEANRDAAEQWAERGATALRAGDPERAVACLQKSLKLIADPRVAALLERAQAAAAGGGGGGGDSPQSPQPAPSPTFSAGSSNSSGGDGVRHRRPAAAPAPAAAAAAPAEAPQRSYTKEQHAEAAAIMAATDYYAVLSLERTAGVDDVKKAYKKKALRLHPDKNAAPNAPDAFKRLSAAAAVLSDAGKRREYDISGQEEAASAGAGRAGGGGGMRRGGGGFHGGGAHAGFSEWEAGIDPDDIFRMFFGMPPMGGGGGGLGGGRMYRDPQGRVFFVNGGGFGQPRRQQRAAADDDPAEAGKARLMQLMQLLPLLLMLLFSLTSGLGGGATGRDAPYMFAPDLATGHTRMYETQPGLFGVTPGVPYYVREGSEVARRLALPGPPGAAFRRQLEQQIDGEAQHYWARRCHDDRQNLAARQRFARDAATRAALEAQAHELAHGTSGSCATYTRLFKAPKGGGS
jgi:DnaJ homolog subfamily B member 12